MATVVASGALPSQTRGKEALSTDLLKKLAVKGEEWHKGLDGVPGGGRRTQWEWGRLRGTAAAQQQPAAGGDAANQELKEVSRVCSSMIQIYATDTHTHPFEYVGMK